MLSVALNVPLFERGEMPYRDSIEGGYASMARFFSRHPNPWGWNPTQYCGLPAGFTYLPGLPYLGAALSWVAPSLGADYAYRLVASALACLGPAALFLCAFYFLRSRGWALAAALSYTIFSPLYYLAHTIDLDRGAAYLPWRLQALVKYGEGPHNAGLTLLPLAVAAVWRAGTGSGFGSLFLAAALLAAVALTNWVAALALAVCCLIVLVTLAGSFRVTGFRARRVFQAGALGYGLACFWLTPSFIRTIAFNWPEDAFHYRFDAAQAGLLAGAPLAIAAARILLGRVFPREYYLRFVTLALIAFGWVVMWFYGRGWNTIPESRRYALEMELFLTLAMFEWLRLALRAPIVPLRYFAVYAAFAAFLPGWGQLRTYVTQGFANRRPAPRESTIEYKMAERLAALQPQGRVFASGGLRFRLNSWFDLAQVGGGFESGLRNRMPLGLAYQIRRGVDSAAGLRMLGVEYLAVHGPHSREHYRDFQNPEQFDGVFERVWHAEDDTIYRVPFSGLAPGMAARWSGASDLWLEGGVAAGQAISVKVNYDPGWRAEQDGRALAVERDEVGFMRLRPAESAAARIHLRYRGTAEQYVMGALSAMVWLGAAVKWLAGSKDRRSPV